MRFVAPLIVFVTLHSSILAQQETIPDSLLQGYKALTFSFSGFYLGGGLGGKYWLDNNYNIRLTLTGSYRNDTDDRQLQSPSSYNYYSSSSAIGIDIGLARKFLATRALFPYLGIAARINQSWYKEEMVYISRTEIEKHTQTRFGGSLFVGIEYWFTESMSFSGEQSISVSYYKYADSKSFSIGNSTSSLLLSIYF